MFRDPNAVLQQQLDSSKLGLLRHGGKTQTQPDLVCTLLLTDLQNRMLLSWYQQQYSSVSDLNTLKMAHLQRLGVQQDMTA